MEKDTVLTMRGIYKSFPNVRALSNVDFTLRKGEIHALMGENGAGKSTLIKVLTGVYSKDEGEIRIDGIADAITIRSPQEAQNYGISTVYQEITLCPNLTVAENMFIGREKGSRVNWKEWETRAASLLESLGIPARAKQQLGSCSLAVQQMVAIARAVDTDCKVLILDEPTRGIDVGTKTEIQKLVLKLADEGMSITFISSEIEEMLRTCSRLIVMRDRKIVGELTGEELTQDRVMLTIAGGDQ